MSSTLTDRTNELVQTFARLPDWEARYKKIIELGREMPEMPENLKTEDAKVKGCQSQVWLHATMDDSGSVHFQGDSDALIVKGLVAVLLRVYSGVTPGEILNSPPEFLKSLGFEGNLSPSRANGLHAMLKQIRNFAVAFDYMLKNKQKTH